ncbi:MAG: hypothetical protein IJB72_03335 [Clostridia bacterium]|nr:hypothetical protein [Clostridia bacterium]
MDFFGKKKENVTSENAPSPNTNNVMKGNSSMNSKKTVVLSYVAEDDLRAICRKEIETLEHWTRRLIHETLTAQYGDGYFSYKKNDEPLIKGEISSRISKMREDNPGRFPRPIDAFFLGDIIYVLCKKSLYDAHFKDALCEAYPHSNDEARFFLERIEAIRNKLSHANSISVREAEQVICYCHDVIESLKSYYRQTGKEKEYNVPMFIRANDSLGNVFLPKKEGYPLERYMDFSKTVTAGEYGIKLRAGETYGISIVVDPAFDTSSYSLEWSVLSGMLGENYKRKWKDVTQISFPVENKTVGSYFEITCRLTTTKDWHKHNWYDDCFELKVYTVLPPIEDNY